MEVRVVLIPIPVLENATDTAEKTGINEYANLCTNQIPCNLEAAQRYPSTFKSFQLALTDLTSLKSVFLCRSKIALWKLQCAATDDYYL